MSSPQGHANLLNTTTTTTTMTHPVVQSAVPLPVVMDMKVEAAERENTLTSMLNDKDVTIARLKAERDNNSMGAPAAPLSPVEKDEDQDEYDRDVVFASVVKAKDAEIARLNQLLSSATAASANVTISQDTQALLEARDAEVRDLRTKLSTVQQDFASQLIAVQNQLKQNELAAHAQIARTDDLQAQLAQAQNAHQLAEQRLSQVTVQESVEMEAALSSKNTEIERLRNELNAATARMHGAVKGAKNQVDEARGKQVAAELYSTSALLQKQEENNDNFDKVKGMLREQENKYNELLAQRSVEIQSLKQQLLESPRTITTISSSVSTSVEKVDESTSTNDLQFESAFQSPTGQFVQMGTFNGYERAQENVNDRIFSLVKENQAKDAEIRELKAKMTGENGEDVDQLRAQVAVLKAQHMELSEQLSRASGITKRLESKMGLDKTAETSVTSVGMSAETA